MREKRVLVGRRITDNLKVIIKISGSNRGGRNEIIREKKIQDTFLSLPFATRQIIFPKEIEYFEDLKLNSGSYTIRISEFVEQEKVFGKHTLEEQFFLIMRELEIEESFYANTFEHIDMIRNVFAVKNFQTYVNEIESFEIGKTKKSINELFSKNKETVETRLNYLTHTDLVPSNFRVSDGKLFMIDLSSFSFANRHEGLGRFLNYCIVHNPKLGIAILKYFKDNRSAEDYLNLRLMQTYKAAFLLNHYNKILSKTEGNLRTLTQERQSLWEKILASLLIDSPVPEGLIEAYRLKRDALRSKEEIERQKEFNIPSL